MTKDEVIRALKVMGDLLEIAEANSFEILAYRNAARNLDEWEGDFDAAVESGALTSIDGVGKGISQIVTDLVRNGESDERTKVLSQFPTTLPDLLTLPGIGPKKVRAIWKDLGIDNLDHLESACREGRVRALRGFGAKTEERVLSTIERRRARRLKASGRTAPEIELTSPESKEAPASSGALFAGTAGYAYKEWKGSFYPDDLAATKFLDFYSGQFASVEINNTFYRFPYEKTLVQWAEQTPKGFLFAVKANQRITHRHKLKNAHEVCANFVERCRALAGRLGPILFQLPSDVKRNDEVLASFLKGLPAEGRYAIEFRHESWFDEAVFDRLRDHHVSFVVHDDEELPTPLEATSSFVYARLRRDEYEAQELDRWNAWFQEQRAQQRDVFVYLKHDEEGASPAPILGHFTSDAAPARRMAKSTRSTRKKAARKRQA
ncbi:MAG: DUF72 domain-containing protein [Planctomycetota bacterium]